MTRRTPVVPPPHQPHHPHHPETTSISEGFDPALSVMAVRPPIYPVSTYAFRTAEEAAHHFDVALGRAERAGGEDLGLIYARLNNPNAEMFEDALSSVERGAVGAVALGSGMAAIATVALALLQPGQVILYQRPIYGGTDHLFHHVLPQWKVEAVAVKDDAWAGALAEYGTRLGMVYLETPGNPTLHMIDIAAIVKRLEQAGVKVPVVVDNTFLGPVFQAPLTLGADLCVYSATKFLGGHSDLVAGAVTGRDAGLIQKVKVMRAFLGTICEPFTAWLLQRSMATLHLRMIKQSKNAAKLVEVLKKHPAVLKVHHPSQFEGEQREVYSRQCSAPGSMIAIEVAGGREGAFKFMNALRLFRIAVSLGGVESLATHPKTTTASEMSDEDLRLSGITEGLVRLSIGVEYWRDQARDLTQALDRV
ncbi:MAG TPA: aminotransferase class I/II-fold pyridoxal phosphate-dependent enzyme [Myxococcota bacterium]|nr:aminotransferase class I/II-fold pyridoxal phosphate-dependent enzyme [Myxococcota bacterium]